VMHIRTRYDTRTIEDKQGPISAYAERRFLEVVTEGGGRVLYFGKVAHNFRVPGTDILDETEWSRAVRLVTNFLTASTPGGPS
jgi:hypothetical protein